MRQPRVQKLCYCMEIRMSELLRAAAENKLNKEKTERFLQTEDSAPYIYFFFLAIIKDKISKVFEFNANVVFCK